jgi:transportin-3
MFQRLVDCAMAGITIQHRLTFNKTARCSNLLNSVTLYIYNCHLTVFFNREACKSILNFLSDIFDLPNTSEGKYRELINAIVLQRGATLTRIMIAALTGALPSGRLEEVRLLLLIWGCLLLYYLD